MALAKRDGSQAADWVWFRDLTTAGQCDDVVQSAHAMIAGSAEPFQVAQAFIERGAASYGARNWDALLSLVAKVEEQLQAAPHPRQAAQHHTLVGAIAYEHHSYGIALLHAMEAEGSLQRMDEHSRAAVDAWRDLAGIYSKLGKQRRHRPSTQQVS
jgi:hypothetical protein